MMNDDTSALTPENNTQQYARQNQRNLVSTHEKQKQDWQGMTGVASPLRWL
jgi:hypothetical protein